MKFYSTRNPETLYGLKEALNAGLAPDGGLFMPSYYPRANNLVAKPSSFDDLAFSDSHPYLSEDLEDEEIKKLTASALNFVIPLKKIEDNIYVLELFHGPTLAFKDVGARFMAGLMPVLNKHNEETNILVATSGDTGGAVASAFHGVENIRVTVLYPEGKVSEFQKRQFTTLGDNINCLAVKGNFDDCQRLVKNAFNDKGLRRKIRLSSANSINIGRWLPQSFYYHWGLLQWQKENQDSLPLIAVPSGNYGNLTAGILAHNSGIKAGGFIAASNINNTVPEYLETGNYLPRKSVPTVANAMDVGDPSNFERMKYMGKSLQQLRSMLSAYTFSDKEIIEGITYVHDNTGYILDPHSATAYMALKNSGRRGFFIATAHPVKFMDIIPEKIRKYVKLPSHFSETGKKSQAESMSADYDDFHHYLSRL